MYGHCDAKVEGPYLVSIRKPVIPLTSFTTYFYASQNSFSHAMPCRNRNGTTQYICSQFLTAAEKQVICDLIALCFACTCTIADVTIPKENVIAECLKLNG